MERKKEQFVRGLSDLLRSMDPMDMMCLCRGVPRAQLSEGQCDMDDCITRYLVADQAGGRDKEAAGTEDIERYALYQT